MRNKHHITKYGLKMKETIKKLNSLSQLNSHEQLGKFLSSSRKKNLGKNVWEFRHIPSLIVTGEGIPIQYSWLPLWFSWLRICLQCRKSGFNPRVGKIPWRRERLPAPVFCLGEFLGLYSPRGCRESDTTEQLSLSLCVNRL